jgi:transposase
LDQGKGVREAARLVKASPSSVCEWKHAFACGLSRTRVRNVEIHDHNIRTVDVVTFVRGLHQHLGRPLILICDRYSVHRSAIGQLEEAGASWLTVELLPVYAPELKPVEAAWNHTKYADLANLLPDDIDHLFEAVGNSLDDLTFKNDLKHSYFRWAKLPLGG